MSRDDLRIYPSTQSLNENLRDSCLSPSAGIHLKVHQYIICLALQTARLPKARTNLKNPAFLAA